IIRLRNHIRILLKTAFFSSLLVEHATKVGMLTNSQVGELKFGERATSGARQRTIDAEAKMNGQLDLEISEAKSTYKDYDFRMNSLRGVHARIDQPLGLHLESKLVAVGLVAGVRARYLYKPFGEI